jgi:basic membrane protein A
VIFCPLAFQEKKDVMKKISLLFTVLLVLVMAVPALTSSAQAEEIRIAVVMPSTINDLAFSQSIYDALVAIDEEYEEVVEIAYSENMFVVEDAAAALRDYAAEGYNLVIGHGSQYGSSVAEIAPDFPDTAFAWGTTVDTFSDQGITNVYAYEARSEQGAFVMGVMAAMLTGTGVLGVVGPIETKMLLYVMGKAALSPKNLPSWLTTSNRSAMCHWLPLLPKRCSMKMPIS